MSKIIDEEKRERWLQRHTAVQAQEIKQLREKGEAMRRRIAELQSVNAFLKAQIEAARPHGTA
jgi:hypothetical protein